MSWQRCDDQVCERWHCAHPLCGAHPDRAFCDTCRGLVASSLAQLPGMYDKLARTPTRRRPSVDGLTVWNPDWLGWPVYGPHERPDVLIARKSGGPPAGELPKRGESERVSGTKDAPLPPGSAGFVTADDLLGLVLEWEDNLRIQRGWPARPYRGRHHVLMRATCRWLGRYVPEILDSPDAVEFGTKILHAHRRAEVSLRLDQLTHNLPAPCGRCDQLALIRRDGEGVIRCLACFEVWPETDLDWFVLVEAQDMPAMPERERRGPDAAREGTDARTGTVAHRETA